MSINIKNTDDDFFRYKMPQIITKVEGRGNGIKTVVSNIVDVAKALGHPPIYPTKFMAYELGASTVYDDKNDRYIIRGAHTAEKLQSLLKIFISKFVLCDQCENPETSLSTMGNKKHQTLTKNCKACGYSGKIESANRLMAFVLKNHSQYSTGAVPKVELQVEKVDSYAVDEPPQESLNKRVNKLFKFVKKMLESGANVSQNDVTILREAESLEVRKEAPYVLVEVLFDGAEDIFEKITSYRNVFLRICHNARNAQKSLIAALVQLILSQEIVPKSAHILKKMYDLDVLEEDVLVDWFDKTTKKGKLPGLIEVVRPFIQWLIDAEEESEEDTEDDAVIISATGAAGIQTVKAVEESDHSEVDSDINIDDI